MHQSSSSSTKSMCDRCFAPSVFPSPKACRKRPYRICVLALRSQVLPELRVRPLRKQEVKAVNPIPIRNRTPSLIHSTNKIAPKICHRSHPWIARSFAGSQRLNIPVVSDGKLALGHLETDSSMAERYKALPIWATNGRKLFVFNF